MWNSCRLYAATSLRAIATESGVDPVPFAAELAEDGLEGLAARLARAFLALWDAPATRAPLLAVFRSAMTQDTAAAALLREFLAHELYARIAGLMDDPHADLRANLAGAHLIGVAVLRYVLRVEPIASADTDTLVALLTPALTGYLTVGG
jgi:Tetracyclin repressor-like, C-terminal domain